MRSVRWEEIPEEQVRPGVSRRGFGTPNCLLVMNTCEPGMDLRPHVHDFDQIALVLSGVADYYVAGVPNRMEAGSVLLVPAGMEHYIEPLGNEPVENIDVFAPCRADLAHLLAWMREDPPRSNAD